MSHKRFVVLISERGDLTCLPAGDPRIIDRYHSWQVVIGINRPLTTQRANTAKSWAVHNYYC